MKQEVENETEDELRPEYDFAQMKGGVRDKYVERYRQGTNLVLLDPDVAQTFPNGEAVNQALRAVRLLSWAYSPVLGATVYQDVHIENVAESCRY